MFCTKLGSVLFVLVFAVALVPRIAVAADGPFVCADEAVPTSCVLRRVQMHLGDEARVARSRPIEPVAVALENAASAPAPFSAADYGLLSTDGVSEHRQAQLESEERPYDGASASEHKLLLSASPIPAYDGAPRETASENVLCANPSEMAQRICKDEFIVP